MSDDGPVYLSISFHSIPRSAADTIAKVVLKAATDFKVAVDISFDEPIERPDAKV